MIKDEDELMNDQNNLKENRVLEEKTDTSEEIIEVEVKTSAKLGLFGLTMNACAMIAPGVFLWATLQIQAADSVTVTREGVNGTHLSVEESSAEDLWFGVFFAVFVAFLTAIPFSELSRRYDQAGCGGAYYFTEVAFSESRFWHRATRIAKWLTAAGAILFYSLYPGVMCSFLAVMVSAVFHTIFGADSAVAWVTGSLLFQAAVVCAFSTVLCVIVARGISGTTNLNIAINIIQWVFLALYCALALSFRWINPMGLPPSAWAHASAVEVVTPHAWTKVFSQSAIAILILVGFESATAMGSDAEHPKRDIPRAVLLSLFMQGAVCYFLQYFATGYVVNDRIVAQIGNGTALSGFDALASSGAPMGDILIQIMGGLFGGGGAVVWCLFAVSVIFALVGTTLSGINTSARIALAISLDDELPRPLSRVHANFQTPWVAIICLGVISTVAGTVGCISVEVLTGITKAANMGIFLLYAMICLTCIISFSGPRQNPCRQCDYSCVFRALVPSFGFVFNVLLLCTVFKDIPGAAQVALEDRIAIAITSCWFGIYGLYFIISNLVKKKPFCYHRNEDVPI